MCTVLLPPGVNPIAVKKYIISYHIISYIVCTIRLTGHANIACVTSSRFASYGYSLAVDRDESWVSYSGRFTPGERSSPRTFWIGGLVGRRTNLDTTSRIEPRFLGWLAHSPSRYTDYAPPGPKLHHREKSVTQWDGCNRQRPRKLALAVTVLTCSGGDRFGPWNLVGVSAVLSEMFHDFLRPVGDLMGIYIRPQLFKSFTLWSSMILLPCALYIVSYSEQP